MLHDEALLAFWVRGDPPQCLRLIKKAIAIDPTFPEAFALLGEIKAKLGDDKSAVEAYRKAEALGFCEPALYYNLGNALQRNNELLAAIEQFTLSIELGPIVQSWVNRASCFFKLKYYRSAAEDLVNGLSHWPTDEKAVDLFLRAMEHIELEAQLNYYERALKYAGKDLRLLNTYGAKLKEAGQPERAKEIFTRLGELAPTDPQPWNNLAAIYLDSRDSEKAFELIQRALELDPDNPDCLFNLAIIKYRSNHINEALQDFGAFVEKYPDDHQARRWLALCHLIVGDPTRAYTNFLATCSGPSEIPFDSAFVIELINTFWWSCMPELSEMILAQIEIDFCRNDWNSLEKVMLQVRKSILDASIEDLKDKLRPRDHIAILCCRALELMAKNSQEMEEAVNYLSMLDGLPTSASVILSARAFQTNVDFDRELPRKDSLLFVVGLRSWLLLNAGIGHHSLDLKNNIVISASFYSQHVLNCLNAYEVARQQLAVSVLDQGRAILMDATFPTGTKLVKEKSSRRLRTLKSLFDDRLSRPPVVRLQHTLSEQSLETSDFPNEVEQSPEWRFMREYDQANFASRRADIISSVRADWPTRELFFGPDKDEFEWAPYFETIASLSKTLSQPLIYIAYSTWAGVANIVNNDDVTTVDLPDLCSKNIEREVGKYIEAQQSLLLAANAESLSRMQQRVDDLTKWLWTTVMEPIVEWLIKRNDRKAILVPGGLLGLLPLSAAQHIGGDGRRRYALDDIVFTCTPTARIAESIMMDLEPLTPDSQFLGIVGDEEESIVSDWFHEVRSGASKFKQSTVICGKDVNRKSILERLSAADVIHICGHGDAGAERLLHSKVYFGKLETDFIGIEDLLKLGSIRARMIILAACQVGLQSKLLPDECLSLPTMLLRAGTKGVIAPIWPVESSCTAILLTKMYDFLFQDGHSGDPIQALADAQRWMRSRSDIHVESIRLMRGTGHDFIFETNSEDSLVDRRIDHPFYWAGFTYFGF